VEAPVEELVTIVQSPTPPPAGATPAPTRVAPLVPAKAATPPPTTIAPEAVRAQQLASQVSALLAQADTAVAARSFDSAAGLFDEALRLDPQNAKAAAGKAAAQAAASSLKRSFASSRTIVRSAKAAKGGPAGFDTDDVSLAKAPDYSGLIEFEASPRNVKAGDNYTVRVFLTNDGKKALKIGSITLNTTVNGDKSATPVSLKEKEVAPQQKILLQELPGVWPEGVSAWKLEVEVRSASGDTFKNTLNWK
jgi:hypothetical protein